MPTLLAAVPAAPPLPSPTMATAIAWAAWITLMGFPGLVAFALVTAGPAARRAAEGTRRAVTARLSRCAMLLAVLAVPAVLADLAQDATTGSRYSAAWHSLYDGTGAGLLAGLEVTLVLVGAVLIAPLAVRTVPPRWRRGLLVAGLVAGAAALATTKLPAEATDDPARTCWKTAVWVVHLLFGASWLGGLAGLLVLAVPGAIAPGDRGPFWSAAIRRFSAVAMTGVGAIALSGLFLYWSHVDGPSQLLSTLYGRTLSVKIVLFGALLLLGVANQFWLHPRIEAARAAGDTRPLRTILLRRFPAVVAVELVLILAILFVAPMLHGSARAQAVQSATGSTAVHLPDKQAGPLTWVLGSAETLAVLAVLIAGYRVSGRIARRRAEAARRTASPAAGRGARDRPVVSAGTRRSRGSG
jgi:putative copper export protein